MPLRIEALALSSFACLVQPAGTLAAAAGFVRAPAPALPQFVAAAPAMRLFLPTVSARTPAAAPGEFLGSRRLAVSHTVFDAEWARVEASGLSPRVARRIAPAARSDGAALLAQVNAWTNRHIRFADDSALYGRADYWADARTTLRKGAGDCEDIAILKMKLLAAAGVPSTDMVLTVARDLARNADHALLVVRQGGRYWLLDNATDAVLDAAEANDYRPVFSYSAGSRWLHGY